MIGFMNRVFETEGNLKARWPRTMGVARVVYWFYNTRRSRGDELEAATGWT